MIFRKLSFFLGVCLLSGCGFAGIHGKVGDRANDYLEARSGEPLKYPQGVNPPSVSQKFIIPQGERAQKPVSIEPPGVM